MEDESGEEQLGRTLGQIFRNEEEGKTGAKCKKL